MQPVAAPVDEASETIRLPTAADQYGAWEARFLRDATTAQRAAFDAVLAAADAVRVLAPFPFTLGPGADISAPESGAALL